MPNEAVRMLLLYGKVRAWVELVEQCLAELPEEERRVVEGYYGVDGGVSVSDLEFELSKSRSTIFRMKRRGIGKLSVLFALTRVALFWDDIIEHMC